MNNKVIEAVRDGVVEIVQVYYIDYLQRCQDYGFNIDHIPKLVKVKADDEYGDVEDVPRPPDMGKMTSERNAKMERFRRSKQLESDLGKLKKVLAAVVSGAAPDEDVLRDYYLKLIQKSVYTSLDELASLEMEVGVLRHMAKLRAGQIAPEPERQRDGYKFSPLGRPGPSPSLNLKDPTSGIFKTWCGYLDITLYLKVLKKS